MGDEEDDDDGDFVFFNQFNGLMHCCTSTSWPGQNFSADDDVDDSVNVGFGDDDDEDKVEEEEQLSTDRCPLPSISNSSATLT